MASAISLSKITVPSSLDFSVLEASPLFTGMPLEDRVAAVSASRVKGFDKQIPLFHQGHPVNYLMLIQEGHVKVTQLSATGSEVILWMCGPGAAIGVLSDPTGRHSCSARSMDRVVAYVWDQSTLRSLKSKYPQIHQNESTILSNRIDELEERFREISTELAPQRLALTLLRLAEQIGRRHPDGVQIFMSREEMSQMTGTTLFTVSRTLSKWARQGLVKTLRESVVIRNAGKLQEETTGERKAPSIVTQRSPDFAKQIGHSKSSEWSAVLR